MLRADRYAANATPALADFIDRKLRFISFEKAKAFYAEAVPYMNAADLALLGCNDRFFLLTGLLNRPDALRPWVYDRCREMETRPDGYLDLWARWHYKSTLGTFAGSIQEILCDPDVTIGIFSATKDIATPFLNQIKEEFESNGFLKRVYSDVLWDDPKKQAPLWSKDEGIVVRRKGNPKEATVEAHGVIEALPVGRHFQILNYDDLVTEKNVTNPEQLKKTTERFELSLSLGIGPATRRRFFGTRYSFADTYGQLIEHGSVIPRVYPATVDGTLDGDPVLMTRDEWAEIKRDQRSVVAAQMLQNPLAGKENSFVASWLRPYELRPRTLNVYIMGDPSRGRSATSDRTALVVVGIDGLGNKYLLDGYCHRMSLSERWAKLRDLYQKWTKAVGVQIVEVGYERYGQQSDDEYFVERMEREDLSFPIKELNWSQNSQQSKKHRVDRLEPDFRDSRFYVPAKVWHPDTAVSKWVVPEGTNEPTYSPLQGRTSAENRAIATGEKFRIIEPIRRLDEDGNIYDLTRVFFEEFLFFPFSPRDDLIDAMSRIYDMDATPPASFERTAVSVANFADA